MYLSSLKIKNVRCFDDNEQMLLKKDAIKIRLEVGGRGCYNGNDVQKTMSLLEKPDLAVDKNAIAMHGKVVVGTSHILSAACELLLHKEVETVVLELV